VSKVYAIINQKGGVGKTTTAINLATYLAAAGRRVLLIDMDPQANATSGIGVGKNIKSHTIYDLLVQEQDTISIFDVIVPSSRRELVVAPCTVDLAAAEVELVGALARENRLLQAIEPIRQRCDYIIIDCPPSLGLLTVNSYSVRISGLGRINPSVEYDPDSEEQVKSQALYCWRRTDHV
jgi:chromosome partitioning protein